jgi:hypothetical protein
MNGAGSPFANDSEGSFVAAMEQALQVPPDSIRGWSEALTARHNWPAVTRRIIEELATS